MFHVSLLFTSPVLVPPLSTFRRALFCRLPSTLSVNDDDKKINGIARSGFEPMGAYGGIPTRRELGGWKRMAPCAGRAADGSEVKYIHDVEPVCLV